MQNSKNLKKILSSVKEKIIISEAENRLPQSRGEVAAQEQLRIFGQAMSTKGEPRAPTTRGEIAAQEQLRIFGQAMATKGEPRAPTTRGEIAAQEQLRILQHAIAASKGKSPEVKSM